MFASRQIYIPFLLIFIFLQSLIAGAKSNYLFDLGPENSPLEPGYKKITNNSCYHDSVKYGWSGKTSKDFYKPDILPGNRLTRDGILADSILDFRVEVPHDEYFVTLFIGTGRKSESCLKIEINGKVVADSIKTPWHLQPYRSIRRRIKLEKPGIRIRAIKYQGLAGILGIEIRPVIAREYPIKFTNQLDTDTNAVRKSLNQLAAIIKQEPNDVDAKNRSNILKKYLRACYYYDIGWWSWSVKKTGMSIFDRFWAAADILKMIMDDRSDPLYYKCAYLLGRIYYWLYREQGRLKDKKAALEMFKIVSQKYPAHKRLRMYRGYKLPHDSFCDTLSGPGNAPKWALKERKAICQILEVLHWWTDNRQAENGEMGGKFGDDVEMMRWWLPVIYATGDKKALRGYRKLVEGVWNCGELDRAFAKKIDDVEHSAEFFTDTHPPMLMLDYGNPTYIERCMLSMQNFRDVWTGINNYGHRHFRSVKISANKVCGEPPYDVDVPMNARACVAGIWLLWYNRLPEIEKLFTEWADAWLEDAGRTDKGKPSGILPSAVRYRDDSIGAYTGNWYDPELNWHYYRFSDLNSQVEMLRFLMALSKYTGNDKYLSPIKTWARILTKDYADSKALTAAPGSEMWIHKLLNDKIGNSSNIEDLKYFWAQASKFIKNQKLEKYLKKNGPEYMKYKITGKDSFLINGFDKIIEELDYNFPLRTEEVKFTDRVDILNINHLFSVYTGGMGSVRTYPNAFITWKKTGTDVAILVEEAKKDFLDIALYNFSATKNVLAQLWGLQLGDYKVKKGIDIDNDGRIDKSKKLSSFSLTERGQTYLIDVPQGKLYRTQMRLINSEKKNYSRLPDIAIAESDVSYNKKNSGKLEIVVHNIGNEIAEDIKVELIVDNQSQAYQVINKLAPSRDLNHATHSLYFKWDPASVEHIIKIDISIDKPEITRMNNKVIKKIRIPKTTK
jgi:hypothetical protein